MKHITRTLIVPAGVYTSRRAVVDWLNKGNGPDDVGVGELVRVQASGERWECVVVRKKWTTQLGGEKGLWRLVGKAEAEGIRYGEKRNRTKEKEARGKKPAPNW